MGKFAAYILIGLLIFGMACSDNPVSSNAVSGSHQLITVTRDIPAFSAIKNKLVADINIKVGPEQEVSLTVDDNIAEYIVLSVTPTSELVIRTGANIELSDYDLTLNLTMTDLTSIQQLGVGQISSIQKLNVENLDIDMEGTGTINLDLEAEDVNTTLEGAGEIILCGTAQSHTCNQTGTGILHAFDLETIETVIALCGAGFAEVYATGTLEVAFEGACSLYYLGHPDIVQTGTGTGNVIDSNP